MKENVGRKKGDVREGGKREGVRGKGKERSKEGEWGKEKFIAHRMLKKCHLK